MSFVRFIRAGGAVGALVFCAIGAVAPASAVPVVTTTNVDFSSSPFTFNFAGSSFTFQYSGDIFGPTSISTAGGGEVNTIFGSPTTNFPDRGTVIFGSGDQYASFTSPTEIRFSNGGNLIGLSATTGGNTYYGFAYTTDTKLNSYGFETAAGTRINVSDALTASAAPEPASWAMMVVGFGMAGFALRRSRQATIRFA